MFTFLVIIHVLVCLFLIAIVLLQTGKGADIGAVFGGSSQTLFGSVGPGTFLSKITAVAAVLFMLTSLGLVYLMGSRQTKSIMKDINPAPVSSATPASAEKSPTPGLPAQAPQKR